MKKNILVALLITGTMAFTACTKPSSTDAEEKTVTPDMPAPTVPADIEASLDIATEEQPLAMPEFDRFNGKIKEIQPYYEHTEDGEIPVPDRFFVLVENINDQSVVNFEVNHETVLLTELEVDAEVTGFYETALLALMIYPPQHHARVLLGATQDDVSVSRFDENLISMDYPFQLIIRDETEIAYQDGTTFDGAHDELIGRALVVITDVNGVANKIIVLYERAVAPIHHQTEEELSLIKSGTDTETVDIEGGPLQLTPEELEAFYNSLFDPETVQVIIDGEAVDMPTPFVNRETGLTMLPVADIAQALGYQVQGEGEDIVVGQGITFTPGVDSYFFGRMAPIQLGGAPEVKDDVLFVPINFFTEVLNGEAYITDGNIIINGGLEDAGEIEEAND